LFSYIASRTFAPPRPASRSTFEILNIVQLKGGHDMKIGHLAALSLLMATPALAGPEKSVNGVELECKITGSDKTGYSLLAKNTTKEKKTCSATCKLTKKDGAPQFVVDVKGESINPGLRRDLKGDVPYKKDTKKPTLEGPFTAADITSASCS
jgi:hypothetical protein